LLFVFNDPCAEISDTGGTLAVAFSWFTTAIEETFNGVGFRRMIQVTIITNDSAEAQPFVTNQNCFNQVMLHEMGHALGLDHSAVSTAVMAPSVSFAQCSAAARPLQPDDIAGVQFIYGTSIGGTPGAPTNFAVTVAGNNLNMTWVPPASGGAPTGYTLLARVGGAIVASLPVGNVTTFNINAPNGAFSLSILATNASGPGPESNVVGIAVPALPPAPGAPTNLQAAVNGNTVVFTFSPPASGGPVANYVLLAGQSPGFGAPLAALPLGPTQTTVPIGGVPAGTWFVRVVAQNAGGTSAPTNEVSFTVAGPSPPGAPTLNPAVVVANTVALSWAPGAGGAPTSYTLFAAATPGGAPFISAPLGGTSIAFGGVPSNTYYLRMVAHNALGTSPSSNEITVVVP
jgi:hypothetical protein